MELIVAVSREWGIGCGGRLLFSIPEDLRAFRERTHGGVVIMGVQRLTRCRVAGRWRTAEHCPEPDAYAACRCGTGGQCTGGIPLIAGGDTACFCDWWARVYRAFLPYCYRAWVTRVEATPTADRFCPDLSCTPGWSLEAAGPTLHSGPLAYRFLRYRNERVEAAR